MELYVLDSQLRRSVVIDRFDSLIWTERYSESGDFELVIDSKSKDRDLLTAGRLLALNESSRVMKVESIEQKDSDGRSLLSVKGPSIEDIMKDRTVRGPNNEMVDDKGVQTTTQTGKWRSIGLPADIVRKLFTVICVNGLISANDIIPFIASGNLYPADTIPQWDQTVTVDVPIGPLYDAIKSLCDSYGLGFRLTRNRDNSQLFFNVYSGIDRTTKQNAYSAVIFSPSLDNMQNITYLTSTAGYKNYAYVYHPKARLAVPALGYENVSGFDRRVLTVSADDIDLDGQPLLDALTQRAHEELAKQKSLNAIDGEISQYSPYKYNVHYNLGDIVEMRTAEGVMSDMKVSEQIFVSDDNGDRSYPTLTTDLFITPGSWYSSAGAHIWDDGVGTWDDAAP